MFKFEYTTTDYQAFLTEFAGALGTPVINDRVIFPESIGKGYIQLIKLPNDLQAIVSDYTVNGPYCIRRQKTQDDYYTLRYEEISANDDLTLLIDADEQKEIQEKHSVIYLTSTIFDISYLAAKGGSVKGINIIFNKDWLAKNLGLTDPNDVLSTYINLKTASCNVEPLDAEYKRLYQEIMQTDNASPLWLGIVQNRMMMIIERFFTRLYEKKQSLTKHIRISKHDISSLQEIEEILTKDVTITPPTIEKLAVTVAMSPAKLKRIFKEVYDSGIYSYYQKQRMVKAREMLLTGDYSVKEVGMHVGYSNLSNFATAFKKEFGVLPGMLKRAG